MTRTARLAHRRFEADALERMIAERGDLIEERRASGLDVPAWLSSLQVGDKKVLERVRRTIARLER